jgi:hypothetical protein
MKKFKVTQRRTCNRDVSEEEIIEAKNEEDAEDKARDMEDKFEYDWTDDYYDYEYDIEEVK